MSHLIIFHKYVHLVELRRSPRLFPGLITLNLIAIEKRETEILPSA